MWVLKFSFTFAIVMANEADSLYYLWECETWTGHVPVDWAMRRFPIILFPDYLHKYKL